MIEKINRISNLDERKMFVELIDFLENKIPFDDLETGFYFRYFDSDESNFEYGNFISQVCEKMDFTHSISSENESSYGWINISDFKLWLIKEMDQLFQDYII